MFIQTHFICLSLLYKTKKFKILRNFDYILFSFIFSMAKPNMRKSFFLAFFFSFPSTLHDGNVDDA